MPNYTIMMRTVFVLTALCLGLAAPLLHAQSQEINKQLVIAANKGDTARVQRMLKAGADINTQTPDGNTALMYAAQNGDTAMTRFLLRHKAATGLKPWNGITALHAAVINQHPQVVQLLLGADANPEVKDAWQLTPLHYAAAMNFPVIAEHLLINRADPFMQTPAGNTPLHLAATTGNPLLSKVLLYYGSPAMQENQKGFLALHMAAQYGYTGFIRSLRKQAVAVYALTHAGLSAVDIAAANGHTGLIRYYADSLHIPANKAPGWNALSLNKRFRKSDSLRRILRNAGQTYNWKPWPAAAVFSYTTNWNGGDFINGLGLGYYDLKWNYDLLAGFSWRPYDAPVHVKESPRFTWQFREKRYNISLWLDKYVQVKGSARKHQGIFIRGGGLWSWGSYAGTTRKPESGLHGMAGAGYYWKGRYIGAKVGYMYQKISIAPVSPHRIVISVSGRWPFRKLPVRSVPEWYN